MDTLDENLSQSFIDEIVSAVGLPRTSFTHKLFGGFFRRARNRLAYLGAKFDHLTWESGLPAASKWMLKYFCGDVVVHGEHCIPGGGPLLVISNHPGTYDSLVLFSLLTGHAIQCVTNVIPSIHLLPNFRQHCLFTPRNDIKERMLVFRAAIRHLNEGGTLIYFGAGHREPDPEVYSKADESIDNWLHVFATFFHYVRDLKIMPVIMSGVVSKKWVGHPITWLRMRQIDRQRLAEFCQVIYQLCKPGKLMLTPRVSFGIPFSLHDLSMETQDDVINSEVIARTHALFRKSKTFFGDFI